LFQAERYKNSFVFESHISQKTKLDEYQAVAAAPWWLSVPGADWRHPAGPGSSIRDSKIQKLKFNIQHNFQISIDRNGSSCSACKLE